MNIQSKKLLGRVMLIELILYNVYSLTVSLCYKPLGTAITLLVSCTSIVPVFAVPLFLYVKGADISFKTLLHPNEKSPLDRTPNLKFTVFSLIFTTAITISAVNLVSLATDAVFNLFGSAVQENTLYSAPELVLIFIRNVLIASVLEELLLRGAVLHATRELSLWKRALFSALFFALIHCNLRSFFYAFAAGTVIAYFAIKTNSVIYGTVLHFLQNLFAFVFTVLRQYLPESLTKTLTLIAFILMLTVAAFGLILMLIEQRSAKTIAPATDKTPNSAQSKRVFPTELAVFVIAAGIITAITF